MNFCKFVRQRIFLDFAFLLLMKWPQIDIILQMLQAQLEFPHQMLEFNGIKLHSLPRDAYCNFGHDFLASYELNHKIIDSLYQILQMCVKIIVRKLDILLATPQQLKRIETYIAFVIQILYSSEDAIDLSLYFIQFCKQQQSISSSFEGKFLLKLFTLVIQAKWCNLFRLLQPISLTIISIFFGVALEHVYVTISILIAMEMDILSNLCVSGDTVESWSLVEPAFLSLSCMKSANLRGVAGLLFFLMTEWNTQSPFSLQSQSSLRDGSVLIGLVLQGLI